MTKGMWVGAFAVAMTWFATPASAQYRFDPRIDPSQCRWTDVCDYGGRAYRSRRIVKVQSWRAPCRIVSVEEPGPNGAVITRQVRRCALSVRG